MSPDASRDTNEENDAWNEIPAYLVQQEYSDDDDSDVNDDESMPSNNGYQLLTQDQDVDDDAMVHSPSADLCSSSNLDDNGEISMAKFDAIFSFPPILKDDDDEAAPPASDIHLDSEKINHIKETMSKFTLPPSSIPEWASVIPEDQWRSIIESKLEKNSKN